MVFTFDSSRSAAIWNDPLNVTNTYYSGCYGNCKSEIEFTVAELVDDYIHLFYVEDRMGGPHYDYECFNITNNPMVYLPIPKDGLMNILFTDVPEWSPGPNLPVNFRLGRNFPNPFNSANSFYFDGYTPGHYEVNVLDINGRIVRQFLSEDLEPGRHVDVWDGRSDSDREVPSGTYFLRAKGAKENQSTHKMILVK